MTSTRTSCSTVAASTRLLDDKPAVIKDFTELVQIDLGYKDAAQRLADCVSQLMPRGYITGAQQLVLSGVLAALVVKVA